MLACDSAVELMYDSAAISNGTKKRGEKAVEKELVGKAVGNWSLIESTDKALIKAIPSCGLNRESNLGLGCGW